LGWPLKRPRQYCILFRSESLQIPVGITSDLCASFVHKSFDRIRSHTWTSLFWVADDHAAAQAKRSWALTRKLVTARRASIAAGTDEFGDDLGSWSACLTLNERRRVVSYSVIVPGECGDLCQEPDTKGLFSRDGELCTIIKNVGLLWAAVFNRWLLRIELLAAMGFLVTASQVAANSGVPCQFTESRTRPCSRTLRTQGHCCGNAFHMNAVGAIVFAVLFLVPDVRVRDPGASASSDDTASSSRKRAAASSTDRLFAAFARQRIK
jgi:hypothetical protein